MGQSMTPEERVEMSPTNYQAIIFISRCLWEAEVSLLTAAGLPHASLARRGDVIYLGFGKSLASSFRLGPGLFRSSQV